MYRWNAQLASAYWTPIHFLEVAVRNAVHDALTAEAGSHWWFAEDDRTCSVDWMHEREGNAVADAISKIKESNAKKAQRSGDPVPAAVTPGSVVAELPFGFWVGLLSGRREVDGSDYHFKVWVEGRVSERFSGTPKRSALHGRLNALRAFRNRIAHHEHLLNQELDVLSEDLHVILRSLCPQTAMWVQAMSEVEDIRSRRP
ncbi:MAG: Abi family protein [Gaiellaceae bacterium]